VHVHGAVTAWYRVRHDHICLICREIPGQWRHQACVEAWLDLPDGRVRPEVYVMAHFTRQGAVGALQIYRDQYIEVDASCAMTRTITTAESREVRTRSLWLAEHSLTWIARDWPMSAWLPTAHLARYSCRDT
jgi:hypothetical protein